MLEIPEAYFRGEVREDFYVEEMMKRAWAAEMKVLVEIDRICKKYEITYFADGGTLLGAVRHQGFIPWDDDIDITMKPKDYNRFLQVAVQELPHEWELLSLYTNEKYNKCFARVVNSNKVNTTEEWLKEWYGCPFSVGVDVFPLNYMPIKEDEIALQKKMFGIVQSLLKQCERGKEIPVKILQQTEELCGIKLNRSQELKKQLARLADAVRQMYDTEEEGEITQLEYLMMNENIHFQHTVYEDVIWMPFEMIEVAVPVGYETVLRAEYGEDYMIPVRGGQLHEYPFYKKQLEEVAKITGRC